VKLSDVMSAMQLAHYAEVALVIFFGVFVLVVLHVMRRGLRKDWERAAKLPLEEGPEDEGSTTRGSHG
jgi:cbb3-type cytochrome oxidase subunit 3